MRYARGGFSDDEKQDLIGDLLELAALLATDIGSDLAKDSEDIRTPQCFSCKDDHGGED